MNAMQEPSLPIGIVGAGPVGLATAAHLIERGPTPLVFERGAQTRALLKGETGVCQTAPSRPSAERGLAGVTDGGCFHSARPSGTMMP